MQNSAPETSVTRTPLGIDPAYTDTDTGSIKLRRFLFGFYFVTGAVYLSWRLTAFNPDAWFISLLFYAIEFLGFWSSVLLFFITMRRRHRSPPGVMSDVAVDVFVTTYNEDIDVVRRSLVAARRIRYPHQTWLLDDGDRPAFRAMTEELGCRYLSRGNTDGAKAGNLNYGLQHATGDFFAILDADHCADPSFLDRLLGYFTDPKVAFVQTPQDYFNLNSFQHGRDRREKLIWHEQSGFHHVEQPGRDHLNSATLCGCSCVMRRSHIESIGGFPTDSVTEDMHAAVKLQKLGFKTVYHDEPLAFGVAPPDLLGFLVQRLRWGEGNMQVCRLERLPFSPKLSLGQNLSYLLLGLAYADAWRKLALYAAPIFTLLTATPPVFGEPGIFLLFFLPYFGAGVLTYQEFYAGFGRIIRTEVFAMARLGASLAATWGLFRRKIRFRVSSKRLVGHSHLLLVLPQAAIFAVGLYTIADAAINAAAVIQGHRPQNIPLEIVSFLVLLVAYHCALAFEVLRETLRSSRTNEAHYQFDVPLPVRLTSDGHSVTTWTDFISIERATIIPPSTIDLNGKTATAEIFLPAGPLKTAARVHVADDGQMHLHFVWSALAVRDELDHSLHAGRWHRIVTGRYEVTMSPLEQIGILTPSPTRMREARGAWEPVLVRALRREQNLHLGYVCFPQNDADGEVILFGDLTGELEIVASRMQGLTGRSFKAEGQPNRPLLDESAVLSHSGFRYRLAAANGAAEARSYVPVVAAE